jgi:DNA-directed RNA polymerase specialized sigma24 family protein
MTDHPTELSLQLVRWFELGDRKALEDAYRTLQDRLVPTPETFRVLGGPAADEIRQDVLARLLNRPDGPLRGAQFPVAFTKTVWRRELASAIRKWGPRTAREDEVRQHALLHAEVDEVSAVEASLDAERAIRIAAGLPLGGRLAVLLTVRPDRISDADWSELVRTFPPPPPTRPTRALEREEASLLVFPPEGQEDGRQRNQRLNSFDKAYKRAIAKIRELMEVGS